MDASFKALFVKLAGVVSVLLALLLGLMPYISCFPVKTGHLTGCGGVDPQN